MLGWFVADAITRTRVRERLRATPDLERALSRLAVGRGGPRDLAMVRDGLAHALELKAAVARAPAVELAPLLDATLGRIGAHGALIDLLTRALVAEPPVDASGGNYIAPGYDAALDELRSASADGRRLIAALE